MKNLYLNKSLIIFLILFQLTIFVSLMPVFFLTDFSSDIYRNILVLVFLECVALSCLDKGFNIYQIFLFMMFLFNIAIPIFSLFDLYSYPLGNRIMISDGIKTVVSAKTLTETYQVLISMIVGSSVGWLIGILNFDKKNKKSEFSLTTIIHNSKSRNIIKYIFFILLALVVYRNFLFVYYSGIYGYIGVIHLQSTELETSRVLILADILFKVSGYAMLFQSRNHKEYIKYATLFMIPFFIQAGTGARGETIAIVITVIFIYSHFFNQLKFKKLISIGIILFMLSIVIGAVRFGGGVGSVLTDVSIFNLILYAIISTSGSIGVIAYTIELKDQFFNSIPFLFGYIQGIFSLAPNYTYEGIQNKNYLAQHLVYITEPDKLYNGSTIGTAMGAEFYEFADGSMVIIFILTAMVLYFAKYFINRLNKNIIMFYLGALYIETLLLSPRGSIMKIFNKESVISMAILIFIALLIWYQKHMKAKK
jgi:hypothetical protein